MNKFHWVKNSSALVQSPVNTWGSFPMKRSEEWGLFGWFGSPPPPGPPPPGGPPLLGGSPLGILPPMNGPPGCCPPRGWLLLPLGPGSPPPPPLLRKAHTWLHPIILLIVCVAMASCDGRGIDTTKWARLSSSGFGAAITLISSGSLLSCSDGAPVWGVDWCSSLWYSPSRVSDIGILS